MKKEYEFPEIEVIEVREVDVVTASPGASHAGDPDCLVDF